MKLSNLKKYPFLVISLLLVCYNAIMFKSTRFHYLGWDESVYLSMGKYIATGGDYGLWESIRPPLLPLILSPFSLTKEFILASEIIILIFTIGTVILTYLITKDLYNKKTAAITVLVLSFTPLFLFSATQILTGMPALFCMLLALYLFMKERYFMSGMITAGAFLTRFPAGIFLIALLIILAINKESKKKYFQILCGASLPILFFLIINIILYQHETASLFDAALRPFLFAAKHQFNPLHTQALLYYPLALLKTFPLLLFSLIPLIQWAHKKETPLPHIIVPLLLFLTYFTIITNKQLRFAVLFLPFIAIYAARGILIMYEKCKEGKQKKTFHKVFFLILILSIIASCIVAAIGMQKNMRFSPEKGESIHFQELDFFESNNIQDVKILTTNPQFAIHSKNLFIPMYNDVETAKTIYEKETYDYLIYDSAFFPCTKTECEESKEALQQQILNQNEIKVKTEKGVYIVKAISKVT